jgi:Prealbumin-like fold domain
VTKDLPKKGSNYKSVAKLSIISLTSLVMIFAVPASFVSNNHYYHAVFAAAKNATKSTSSSSKGGGGGSANNSTSPIGSSTLLKVITKVDNTKGGTKNPSDFTMTVSANSPSPKSFPGSSSGTSVTLKTGKYKVAGIGPSGYSIAYSSGCSGVASGGVPIKCTVSSSFSKTISGNSTSTNKKAKSASTGIMKLSGFVKRSDCSDLISPRCPEVSDSSVRVTLYGHDQFGGPSYYPVYWYGSLNNEPRQISIPVGTPYAVLVDDPGWTGKGTFWKWEEGIIHGSCTGHVICNGTMTANGATITVDLYWACVSSPFGRC